MKKDLYFTAGQFAKLHHLNKRTLHYYDDIGLFSPAHKGENGYRYYTYHQSAGLENILALRELGMSIEEIKDYLSSPGKEKFLEISTQKISEIDARIERLRILKNILCRKQEALDICDRVYDGKIELSYLPARQYLLTPVQMGDDAQEGMERIITHLQTAWKYSAYKSGCGSYISLEKVKQGRFDIYDGLFTPIETKHKNKNILVMPEGNYLCGYCIGDWCKIPDVYRRMLVLAADNGWELTGNCYEIGLNEFAITHMEEYVTQIVVQCRIC